MTNTEYELYRTKLEASIQRAIDEWIELFRVSETYMPQFAVNRQIQIVLDRMSKRVVDCS